MENKNLVALIQNGKNVSENMLTLYLQNKGIIFQIAKKYDSMAEMDDLMQESFLGLYEAVEKYDPDMGVAFLTYAYKVISSHLLRYARKEKNIPEYMQVRIRQYEKLENDFLLQYGRKPNNGEFCHYLDISLEQLDEIQKSRKLGQLQSLDEITPDSFPIVDSLKSDVDVETDVLDKVQKEHMKEKIWEVVDTLPDVLPEVIRKVYLDNMTLQEIGDSMGISRDNIAWKKVKALQMLERKKQIQAFKDDYIRSKAMQGNGVERFKRTWTSSTERVALRLMG